MTDWLDELDRLEREATHSEECREAGCKRCYVDFEGNTIPEGDLTTNRYDVVVPFGDKLNKYRRELIDAAKSQSHADYGMVRDKYDAMKSDRDKLKDLLRRVEWCMELKVVYCHVCDEWQSNGHAPDCELAAALGVKHD